MDMRITIDTVDMLLAETMFHSAIMGIERYSTDSGTLVICDPITDKPTAEGKFMRYGQNGNGEPLWTVTNLNRGTGTNCFTIAETIGAFFDIID